MAMAAYAWLEHGLAAPGPVSKLYIDTMIERLMTIHRLETAARWKGSCAIPRSTRLTRSAGSMSTAKSVDAISGMTTKYPSLPKRLGA